VSDDTTIEVPRELQVYVLDHLLPDSSVGRDRNPRSFAPKKVVERLDLPDRVRRKVPHPLPQLMEAARGGAAIEMVANEPPYRGAPDADYCAWQSDNFHIFSRRAAEALRDLLEPAGTFLPLQCPTADLVGYTIDADEVLDKQKSIMSWIGDKFISSVERYAFVTEKLGRVAIFRPPGHTAPLVLQGFVDVVRNHPFTGFNFCRVWPAGTKRWWHHEQWC